VCLSVMNYVAADGGKSVNSGVLVGGKSVFVRMLMMSMRDIG
jgi:hypothetical protein